MFHVQNTLSYVFFDTAKQNSDKTRETVGNACVSKLPVISAKKKIDICTSDSNGRT